MASDLVGTVLDGKFEIEKALASGASGDVYEAMHLALGARVAVKVLRPGVPETADIRRKRFMREARVAARLKSDHVVRVYDIVAREQGPTYIVMELLQGETLADRVRRSGAVSAAEAVDFVLQASKPLAEMHDEGIVHRDVKPSNLFLARDADGKERIKLLDFGVAAFRQPLRPDSSFTWSEAVVGTPKYMAPEQIVASKNVDARADVWALGVTLYELLAGMPPFDGQTVLAVLNQIEHQEPRPLAESRPGVPPALAAVVQACLAKEPDRRPSNARAFAQALASVGRGSASPLRRGRRWLLVAAAAVALAAVIVALWVRRGPEVQAEAALPSATGTVPTAPAASSTATSTPTSTSTLTTTAPLGTSTPTLANTTAPAPRKVVPRTTPHAAPARPASRKATEDDDRIE
jgi:serine/threonine-protein kinase